MPAAYAQISQYFHSTNMHIASTCSICQTLIASINTCSAAAWIMIYSHNIMNFKACIPEISRMDMLTSD